MKKILSLSVAVVLVLSLCSCKIEIRVVKPDNTEAGDTTLPTETISNKESKPEESTGATASTTQPTEPTYNETPYLKSIKGDVPIYKEPSLSSGFVQYVGQDGIYTIVEEAYDSHGNLWGRLKSGLGWVQLGSNAGSEPSNLRECQKCKFYKQPSEYDGNDTICLDCRHSERATACKICGAPCNYTELSNDGICANCIYQRTDTP